jgi:hypothetical protein
MILEFYLVALSNMCQNFRIFCVCVGVVGL